MIEAAELLVDTTDPSLLDDTLQSLGAVLVGGPDDFVRVEGHYVVRCLGNAGFIKFAIENQGYGTVVDGPGNWTMPKTGSTSGGDAGSDTSVK